MHSTCQAWISCDQRSSPFEYSFLPAGFADPFHPVDTITLDNPKFRFFGISLMKGKLDWVLLRRMIVTGTSVGNHDYSASDHKWLCADVTMG